MDPGSIASVAHTAARCAQACQLINQQLGSSSSHLKEPIGRLHSILAEILDVYNSEKAPLLIEVKGDEELSIYHHRLITANETWSTALDREISTKAETSGDLELIKLSRQLTNTVSTLFLPGTRAYEQRRREAASLAAQATCSHATRQRLRRSIDVSSALATFVALSSALRLRTVAGHPLFGFEIGLAREHPATEFSDPHMLVAMVSYLCGLALLVQSRRLAGERRQHFFLPSAWLFTHCERLTREASAYTALVGLLPLWILAAQVCCWVMHCIVRRTVKRQARSPATDTDSAAVIEQV